MDLANIFMFEAETDAAAAAAADSL